MQVGKTSAASYVTVAILSGGLGALLSAFATATANVWVLFMIAILIGATILTGVVFAASEKPPMEAREQFWDFTGKSFGSAIVLVLLATGMELSPLQLSGATANSILTGIFGTVIIWLINLLAGYELIHPPFSAEKIRAAVGRAFKVKHNEDEDDA